MWKFDTELVVIRFQICIFDILNTADWQWQKQNYKL